MDNEKLKDLLSALLRKVKENSEKLEQLREKVEKLENPGAHETRDVNDNLSNDAENASLDVSNKLSNYARKATQDSRGPFKPDELLTHFTSNDFGKKKKEVITVIRKFPNNINEVKNQLSCILEDLETQVTRRKKENELDVQLIQRIRKFNETLEKEQEKEKQSTTKSKIQNTTGESHNVSTRSKNKSSKAKIAGISPLKKPEMPVRQAEKRGRKRKVIKHDDEDNDSCSSQDSELERLLSDYDDLMLSVPTLSSESIELNPAHTSDTLRQHRQPRPVISSVSSLSSSDADSEEDFAETFQETKTEAKSSAKRSKQSECNGNEETVTEKHFSLRGKHNR